MNEILRLAPTCVGDSLRRTARTVSQHYDHALAKVGLNVGQFSILARLAGFKQQSHSPTLGELAQAIGVDRTTLTRALGPLEREGLIAVAEGEDRRTRVAVLCAPGAERLEEALPLWNATQQHLLKQFGSGRWKKLMGELDALTEAVR